MKVSYDGSSFRGFQIQESRVPDENSRRVRLPEPVNSGGGGKRGHSQDSRTVCGVLQSTLRRYFTSPDLTLLASSRTDKGVHADGQHVMFDVDREVGDVEGRVGGDFDRFRWRLNRMLPGDVRVVWVKEEEGGKSWNVMRSARWKRYQYSLFLGETMPPKERNYRTHVYHPIDVDKFRRALEMFVGKHDFAAFGGQLEARRKISGPNFTTVRTIHRVLVTEEGGGRYKVTFELDGALYKMIRNILGCCLDCARDIIAFDEIQDLLENNNKKRQNNKSKPARPEGLTLEDVFFSEWDGVE